MIFSILTFLVLIIAIISFLCLFWSSQYAANCFASAQFANKIIHDSISKQYFHTKYRYIISRSKFSWAFDVAL